MNGAPQRETEPRLESAPTPIAVLVGQLTQGGTERQLYFFLQQCDRSRWQPVVYVSGELGYWEKPLRDLGVTIVLLQGGQFGKLIQFRTAAKAQGAKVFFSWSSYTNGFGLALTGLDVARIGSFRNAFLADLPQRARWLWSWMSLAGVSTIVCNSEETRKALVARCGDAKDIYRVQNAIEVFQESVISEWRSSWRSKLCLADDELLIVGVGRLEPQKNFWKFIEVVARLPEHIRVKAAIAGAGSIPVEQLKEHAARLGVGDRIEFVGRAPDARHLIAAADIFLLTSDHEGMPNVVLEAMSIGVPCVTTDVFGIRELIDNERTGLIATTDAALVTSVRALAEDPDLRKNIGRQARDVVSERFRLEKVAAEIWAICDQAKEKEQIQCA
jgi:glycosyltransferase involved in cell wall biosynthesis